MSAANSVQCAFYMGVPGWQLSSEEEVDLALLLLVNNCAGQRRELPSMNTVSDALTTVFG
jgi:hypothetical protein